MVKPCAKKKRRKWIQVDKIQRDLIYMGSFSFFFSSCLNLFWSPNSQYKNHSILNFLICEVFFFLSLLYLFCSFHPLSSSFLPQILNLSSTVLDSGHILVSKIESVTIATVILMFSII